MSKTLVYLPYGRRVIVRVFVNAELDQRLTIRAGNAVLFTLIGKGTDDHSLGTRVIATPASGPNPLGHEIGVTASYHDGTDWRSSSVQQSSFTAMYFSAILVLCEDSHGDDWNDAACMFSWWVPPD